MCLLIPLLGGKGQKGMIKTCVLESDTNQLFWNTFYGLLFNMSIVHGLYRVCCVPVAVQGFNLETITFAGLVDQDSLCVWVTQRLCNEQCNLVLSL